MLRDPFMLAPPPRDAAGSSPAAVSTYQPLETPRRTPPTRRLAIVDPHSLHVLELPAIRARLAGETAFEGGRALADGLEPSSDPELVSRAQAETSEACALLDVGPPRLAGAHDVRQAAALAARGAGLLPDSLASIAETLHTALDVRGSLLAQ